MSQHRTAWARKASSLPSDRIVAPKAISKSTGISKGKQKETGILKSRAVLKLEKLRGGLVTVGEGVPGRDPKGGCFCQAREHELSTYTPICLSCGLILCSVNLPHYACPHCQSSLLAHPARRALIETLEQAIVDTLAQEEREREQAIEDARKAAGAFPTLAAAASGAAQDAHPVDQPHKVLSLNSKTKKVIVSSYSKPQPQQTLKPKGGTAEPVEPEPQRVPRPPAEVPFSTKPQNAERPWLNVRFEGKTARYVPPPAQAKPAPASPSRKKKNKQSKEGPQRGSNENTVWCVP